MLLMPLISIAAVGATIAAILAIAPRCGPDSKALLVGNSVLLAGCPNRGHERSACREIITRLTLFDGHLQCL